MSRDSEFTALLMTLILTMFLGAGYAAIMGSFATYPFMFTFAVFFSAFVTSWL